MTCIKLASNENPFGPSPRALEAMAAALKDCNLYPDNEAAELRQKLAARHHLAAEKVLVSPGSTALLGIIARTLLAPGLIAITSERSFIVYPIAVRSAGGRLVEVPMHEDGFDLDAIARAIDCETRVIFLANPNNPTGTIFDAASFDRFLEHVPSWVTVVVDEAYYDFAQYFAQQRGVEYSHSLDYVHQERNLVVLRTFSKAHGLAGVRIGYGLGPRELMERFARLQDTFAVSTVAQAAALAALEDDDHVQLAVENNAQQEKLLSTTVSEMGCRVGPTWANFLYCEVGDSNRLAQRLLAEGVLIRSLETWGAPAAIRVTIGTPEQNEIFLKALRKVMPVPVR
jgi:histidinol-phosphate aminotransferase